MIKLSKYQFKFSVICLLATCIFSFFFVTYFNGNKKESVIDMSQQELVFDFSWIKQYCQKYGELNWYTRDLFLGRDPQSQSMLFTYAQIHKNTYNSFEKLVFMLYHLRLFIDDDYASFEQMALFQDSSLSLEFEAFHSIKHEILESLKYREGLSDIQVKKILELALIYSQIHSSHKGQDNAFIYELGSVDKASFFSSMLDLVPGFFPSYEGLNTIEKQLLVKLLQFPMLDSLFNLNPQKKEVTLFKDQTDYASDENLFELIFFLYRCYCPGAHILSLHQNVFYHQKLHVALHQLKQSFFVMQANGVEEGVDHYLKAKRASFNLDPNSIIDLVLEPLFLRLYFLEPKDLQNFKKQIMRLDSVQLSSVITYLKNDDFQSVSFISKILLTMYEQKERESTVEVFQDALGLFIKVIAFLENDPQIKAQVKALDETHLIKALRVNPTKLMAKEISIDQKGTIRLNSRN